MDRASLRRLLDQVSAGTTSVDAAVEELRFLPFENLGFARIDHHRDLRTGIGEMIYCQGKTPDQVRDIAQALVRRRSGAVLATRASPAHAESIASVVPGTAWHPVARLVVVRAAPPTSPPGRVLVLSAGTADLAVAEEAALSLEALGHRTERLYDVGVAGIHRLLAERDRLAAADLLIVCAGMDGALPSVVAGLVGGPIIAVPTSVGYGAGLGGIAPLLTMLNACSPGLAVVNIDNGFGAAALAALILRRRQELSTRLETDKLAAPGAQPRKLDEVLGVQEQLVHPAELVDR